MAKKAPHITIKQIFIIVVPLLLLLPIVYYLEKVGLILGLIIIVFWLLYVGYFVYKQRAYEYPSADALFNSSIERQNKIFIFGIIGVIIFMSIFFGSMYYWLKDVAVVEECKETAFAKGQSVYTTGRVDNETYKKTLDECVKTRKVSFKEFYGDIFESARERAEEEKR